MSYQIVIEKRAQKFIRKQPRPQQERLLRAISKLPEGDVKQLQGNEGLFRLRVGTYRVIYTIDNNRLVITVIDAGNRGQVYQNY